MARYVVAGILFVLGCLPAVAAIERLLVKGVHSDVNAVAALTSVVLTGVFWGTALVLVWLEQASRNRR